MRIARILALGALAAAGCGPEPCGPFADQYDMRFTERPSGTCGELPDFVASSEGLASVGPECSGDAHATECDIVVNERCPNPDGTSFELRGTLSQVDGPDRLEGTLTGTLFDADGAATCISTYDVTGIAL